MNLIKTYLPRENLSAELAADSGKVRIVHRVHRAVPFEVVVALKTFATGTANVRFRDVLLVAADVFVQIAGRYERQRAPLVGTLEGPNAGVDAHVSGQISGLGEGATAVGTAAPFHVLVDVVDVILGGLTLVEDRFANGTGKLWSIFRGQGHDFGPLVRC